MRLNENSYLELKNMKRLLVIYNVIFFLFGSALISNIHHLSHDHDHDHEVNHESHNCGECLAIESIHDFELDSNKTKYLIRCLNVSFSEIDGIASSNIDRLYAPRAPPIFS